MLFLIILLLTISVICFLSFRTRGIQYINVSPIDGVVAGGDAQQQVAAAAQSHLWRWPSDMHKYIEEKARMKDLGVLLLAGFQKLLRDRSTMYPLILLCNIACGLSVLLVFAVSANYWNSSVAFLVSTLLLFSFWPHQITLSGGYQNVALMTFLLAVLTMQQVVPAEISTYYWYAISGICFGMMMFASASGRKWLPLFPSVFIYSQWTHISLEPAAIVNGWLVVVVLAAFLSYLLFRVLLKTLIKRAYYGGSGSFFGRLLTNKETNSLEHYLNFSKLVNRLFGKILFAVVAFIFVDAALSREPLFYYAQFSIMVGLLSAVLFFTLPSVVENIRGYITYWIVPQHWNHLNLYKDYFDKIGKPLKKGMRGAGMKWVFLFLSRFIPFHFIFFIGATIFLFIQVFELNFNFGLVVGIFLLSMSPIIYGEITKSPQFSRPYYPALIGILFLIGYSFYGWFGYFNGQQAVWFLLGSGMLLVLTIVWNAWVFLTDVLPSRMAPVYLSKFLDKHQIKNISTYNSAYNDAFVHALPAKKRDNYTVTYINSLDDVKKGYVVIPGTSSKSVSVESYPEGIQCRDFSSDPYLNDILSKGKIDKYAIASFKTFGSSRFWVHESEMPTYRELILKDITDVDRFKSLAWVVDVKNLRDGNIGQNERIDDK